jgi:hypothetical protein
VVSAIALGGAGTLYVASIDTLADGTTVVGGTYGYGATVGAVALPTPGIPSPAGNFVAQVGPSGTVVWALNPAVTFGAVNLGVAAVAARDDGSTYVAGPAYAEIGTCGNRGCLGHDLFLAQYASTGTGGWISRAGLTMGGDIAGASIAVLPDGTIDVVSTFTYRTWVGSTPYYAAGETDYLLTHLDANGTPLWTARSQGTGDELPYGVAVTNGGTAYVTGEVAGPGNFGGTALYGLPTCYLTKYDATGATVWAHAPGSTGSSSGNAVAVVPDGGVIYVTGGFSSSATFGTTLNSAGSADFFLAQYNASGNVNWAVRGGGSSADLGTAVATLPDGTVYVAGDLSGTSSTFGNTTFAGLGPTHVFVAKYTSGGALSWVKWAGNANDNQYATSIAVASDGSAYVVGTFVNQILFDNTPTVYANGSVAGSGFLVKYNAAGVPQWARSYDTFGGNPSVAVAPDGTVRVAATQRPLSGPFTTLISYSTTGTILWTDNAVGPWTTTSGVATLPDGSAVVSGTFTHSNSFGASTVNSVVGNAAFVAKHSQ